MLALIAALALTAAVPSVEYQVERQGSKEVLLEGKAPLELQRLWKFEHEQAGSSVQLELMVRPGQADDQVTVELQLSERTRNGSHKWSATVVLRRGVATTSDLSWGDGGWRIKVKVG